jgi:hypothetical protein
MTIVGSHLGQVSGLTHFHLLRESAAVRAQKPAGPVSSPADRPAHDAGQSDAARETSGKERFSIAGSPGGID